jgi:hypothetical protein
MPRIYETLTSDFSTAGRMEFVVNSAVPEVAVLGPGPNGMQFRNSTGNQFFELGDNITLLGFTVSIPYGFGQATGSCISGIVWRDANLISYPLPELAQDSTLSTPSVCDLLAIPDGLFVKCPVVGPPSRVLLLLNSFALNVSQLNVPALINGVTVKVRVMLQIWHTKPMSPIP